MGESKRSDIIKEIDVMDAINAHVYWKIRLEKYVNGTSEENLDPEVICRDEQCALVKWIYGPALKHFHADDESFKSLRDDHAQFHVVAGRVVTRVQSNDKAGAEMLMKGEYMNASRKVVLALTELSEHLTAP